MQGHNPQKVVNVCPTCKTTKIHKRKNAAGYFCFVCKVAFSAPLIQNPIWRDY